MKKSLQINLIIVIMALAGSLQANSQNTSDTRFLNDPTVSENHIAFVYAEDLWIAGKDGSSPRRLTIDEGLESAPVFSPDGSMIAFSAEYDGNTDVFVLPATGGVPKRLTWHPSADIVVDFSVNGESVLFNSQRAVYTTRHAKLYSISVEGGQPEELPIPTAFKASYSPDGKYLAYTPNYEVFNQWKHYRGGTQGRIWIIDLESYEVTEIPRPAAGANDADPEWLGKKVYFRSDRNGEFNLYSYDTESKEVAQHTSYDDFPVLSLNAMENDLIYEKAGYIYLYSPEEEASKRLIVGIAADLLELRSRFVSGEKYIRSAGISPSGARAVFDFRGEVVTVPAEKGDFKNLSETPGIHEKYPQWSPDGKHIAYFADGSGEYQLEIKSLKDGSIKVIPVNGAGFYAHIHWSPDSKKLSFVDNSRSIYVVDISEEEVRKINSDKLYTPGVFRELFGSWSHDSKWISYTIVTETNFEQAYAYSVVEDKSYALSDGLSNVTEPVFDPSGKYIYMLASTDAGPVVNWFDQSNQDMEMTSSIYLVTLQKDLVSPLAKENDTEEIEEAEKSENKENGGEKEEEMKDLSVDWEDINDRIISLPIKPGMYYNLEASNEGKIFFLSRSDGGYGTPSSIQMFDLKERKEEKIMDASWFTLSADGKKILFMSKGKWGITATGKKPENGFMNTAQIKVKIDPKKEWRNIFYETWRVNRDYFYDPNMHGADWEAMKEKYEVFLPDLSCKSDLYELGQWMCSELAVGHHRFGSRGDNMDEPEKISGGLLGADYEVDNNRYRFAKIYGGLNWTPDLRSPLTEPGVNVKAGDYLIEVNGEKVTSDQNLYSFFENTAGKIIELKVASDPSGNDSRMVYVVPLENEQALRNRDWIEGNIKKVNEATNGQVAYVYVPNTASAGHEYFKRYFFPQVDKKAVIIDERHNGGGQLADYYIDILKRPYQSSWNFRYGQDLRAPSGSIQGPKVMLIDETAGSGGDYLPWMFRKFGLGKLIGKTTWGGLVGVLGFPEFIDGGSVTAPNLAFYNEDGFRIENEGVAPDIEVEQWPKEVIEGKDPQLEKAIEVILEELEENPPVYPERPEYPVRVRMSE